MTDRKIEHIILISLDTLRADCINASPTAYDYLKKYSVVRRLHTAELDAVLKKSLYFSNCISAAPYTSASHAAYFSGYWPRNNGVYEYFNRRLSKPTIFQYARRAGYSTIFQTDFPVILGSYLGLTKSVQHYYIENERAAFETLMRHKKGKTLSFFHFGGIHYPYGFHNLKFGGKRYQNTVAQLERQYGISSTGALDDILDESFRSRKDKQLLFRYKRIIEHLYSQKEFDQVYELLNKQAAKTVALKNSLR